MLYNISIHSLYAEGDGAEKAEDEATKEFQSTPSTQRETQNWQRKDAELKISIHSLYAEGDAV